jgi:hypothetical protein
MKYAILLYGLMRYYEECAPSLFENIINYNNNDEFDIYIATYRDLYEHVDLNTMYNIYNNKIKKISFFEDEDHKTTVKELCDKCRNIKFDNCEKICTQLEKSSNQMELLKVITMNRCQILNNTKINIEHILTIYNRKRVIKLVKDSYESYDKYIMFRPDIKIMFPLKLSKLNNHIYNRCTYLHIASPKLLTSFIEKLYDVYWIECMNKNIDRWMIYETNEKYIMKTYFDGEHNSILNKLLMCRKSSGWKNHTDTHFIFVKCHGQTNEELMNKLLDVYIAKFP